MQASIEAFHWPFLAQPWPVPERMIGADPLFFLHHLLDRWVGCPGALGAEAVRAYEEAISRPSVVQAMVADYRAGATIDLEQDRQSRAAGQRLKCPVYAPRGVLHTPNALAPIWRRWCDVVREDEWQCGHFLAEEAPETCAGAIAQFLVATGES